MSRDETRGAGIFRPLKDFKQGNNIFLFVLFFKKQSFYFCSFHVFVCGGCMHVYVHVYVFGHMCKGVHRVYMCVCVKAQS